MATRKKPSKASRKKDKTLVKEPKETRANARLRKKPQYKSFRLHPRIKHQGDAMLPATHIAQRAIQLIFANSQAMLWFFAIYGTLSIIFVSGVVTPLNVEGIRSDIAELTGGISSLTDNLAVLGFIIDSSFKASGEISAIYQAVFVIISSLALIWLFRQQQAGNTVTLKQAFYRGMYPLIPFVAVSLFFVVQTLPAVIGNSVYGSVIAGGFAVTFIEQLFWALFYLLTIILTMYLLAPTLLAMFIVTLPEVEPVESYREARELIAHRRISVLIRVVSLILFVAIAYVGLVFPAIFVSAVLAQIVYFVLTIMALPFIVAYLFILYRELL